MCRQSAQAPVLDSQLVSSDHCTINKSSRLKVADFLEINDIAANRDARFQNVRIAKDWKERVKIVICKLGNMKKIDSSRCSKLNQGGLIAVTLAKYWFSFGIKTQMLLVGI